MYIVEFVLILVLEDVIKLRIKLCVDVVGFFDRSDVKFFRNLFIVFDIIK